MRDDPLVNQTLTLGNLGGSSILSWHPFCCMWRTRHAMFQSFQGVATALAMPSKHDSLSTLPGSFTFPACGLSHHTSASYPPPQIRTGRWWLDGWIIILSLLQLCWEAKRRKNKEEGRWYQLSKGTTWFRSKQQSCIGISWQMANEWQQNGSSLLQYVCLVAMMIGYALQGRSGKTWKRLKTVTF